MNKQIIREESGGVQLYKIGAACKKLSISRPTLLELVRLYAAENDYTPIKIKTMVRYSEQDLENFVRFSQGVKRSGRGRKTKTVAA